MDTDDPIASVREELSSSAKVLLHLEAALHELTLADAVLTGSSLTSPDVRELRRTVSSCRIELQRIFDWLDEAPLEEPRN